MKALFFAVSSQKITLTHIGGIVRRSLKSYMVIDLTMLTIIGALLEGLCARFGGLVFANTTPTTFISLFIVFLAVVRWNLWGLITIPFLAIATMIGGMNGDIDTLKSFYNWSYTGWQAYISIICGMLTVGLDVIIFKKFKTKKVVHNIYALVGICIANFVLYNLVQLLVVRLLTSHGDLLHQGYVEYVVTNSKGTFTHNLCTYGEGGFIANLFSLAAMVVGGLILRSQGVMTNVHDKLLDDKLNAELDELDQNFRIEEPEDSEDSVFTAKSEDSGTEDSQEKSL